MYTRVSHISSFQPHLMGLSFTGGPWSDHVSIHPDGVPAPLRPNGDLDLYEQASDWFSRLKADNVFTGGCNTFQGNVVVRRCHVTSDPRAKADLKPLDAGASSTLVRRIVPYAYTIDGEPAAGVLSDDVPVEYTRVISEDGLRTVDYNSLFAHLWAAVRELQERVDRLTTPPPPPSS